MVAVCRHKYYNLRTWIGNGSDFVIPFVLRAHFSQEIETSSEMAVAFNKKTLDSS